MDDGLLDILKPSFKLSLISSRTASRKVALRSFTSMRATGSFQQSTGPMLEGDLGPHPKPKLPGGRHAVLNSSKAASGLAAAPVLYGPPNPASLAHVPPVATAEYARAHDNDVWQTLHDMLGGHTEDRTTRRGRHAQHRLLPASLGGLGLMHAQRLSPAAYWAAWAVLQQRCPEAAERCGLHLDDHGWNGRPSWETCLQPAPPHAAPGEPGVWAHGRQRNAALALHTSFREHVLMPAARPDVRALLRSHAGPQRASGLQPPTLPPRSHGI